MILRGLLWARGPGGFWCPSDLVFGRNNEQCVKCKICSSSWQWGQTDIGTCQGFGSWRPSLEWSGVIFSLEGVEVLEVCRVQCFTSNSSPQP